MAIRQGRFAIGGARRGRGAPPMEIQRKLRARFDRESEFSRQNREWTRAGKRSRHNCIRPAWNRVKPGTAVQKRRRGARSRGELRATAKSTFVSLSRVCVGNACVCVRASTCARSRRAYIRESKVPLAERRNVRAGGDDRCTMMDE